MFIVTLTYTAPLAAVDELVPAHRRWLAEHYAGGVFVASGRRVPRNGGVILAHGVSREELERILATDPLAPVRTYQVMEFVPSMTSPDLASIAESR
ncbi:uncharacterized protein YciI [Streptomyces sp. 846.5]|nr:YciI family protein [Streptomyces sp. 846.5]TDT98622.1 uncharacterized protein YciI [Streptomyces sp. 846.5]